MCEPPIKHIGEFIIYFLEYPKLILFDMNKMHQIYV